MRTSLSHPWRRVCRPWLELLEDRSLPATYTVLNTLDSGAGSLRQAILDANATVGVTDTIAFNIAGAGVYTIAPLSALPTITDPVVLDGTTQPGYAGSPRIELEGSSTALGTDGLVITAGQSTVRGLSVNRFSGSGIVLRTNGNNVLTGNYLGTDATGTVARGNGAAGVLIDMSSDNTIGGTAAGAGNVISGNLGHGIRGVSVARTVIRGNSIGTDASGLLALGNAGSGISLGGPVAGGADNVIGGTAPGDRNVIAGNGDDGIHISSQGELDRDLVQGNYIGLNAAGAPLGNGRDGVSFDGGVSHATIGGTTAGARNYISANGRDGIRFDGGFFHTGTAVLGNYIGTDLTGTVDRGNGGFGVWLRAGRADSFRIGGTDPGAGNLISGNVGGGVFVTDGSNHRIQGNLIGTDVTGTRSLGNLGPGILGSCFLIGGTTTAARNVISGNGSHGIAMPGGGRMLIQGNYVGTDVTGMAALPNQGSGIFTYNGYINSTIGGNVPGAGNLISGNAGDGISMSAASSGNVIAGNFIGVNAAGTAAVPNFGDGIDITASSGGGFTDMLNNRIGTNSDGVGDDLEGNLISGNTGAGVGVRGDGIARALNTVVRGNSIYANGGLGIDLGNDGVTANDPGDGDVGFANNLQNFPVLTAVHAGATTRLVGTLNSTANTAFTLDFYASATADNSRHGEGQRYLGSATVTTDASGNASFDVTLAAASLATEAVSATATGPDGTSEFSAVLNVAPAVGPITGPVVPLLPNTTVNVSAGFTDANVWDTHTALWDWGDGTPASSGMVTESGGSGSVTGSHTYATPGVYTITLTVTDNSVPAASGQSRFTYVVVYDPSAGSVTGGGQITSPAGAASFGFNARYPNGATTPTGQTNFTFPAGDFHFRSSAYAAGGLVVNGFRAQVTGTGTVNGAAGYSFRLTAYDGALPGGGGTDRFRLKVWNTTTSAVVYDNVPGAADDLLGANPQPISGGNVVLHGSPLLAAARPRGDQPPGESLTAEQLASLLPAAVARWGVDAGSLSDVQVLVADLGDGRLGLASGNTIWLDDDAAGWGWFVDATPFDDSEFLLPGDQGEQDRMDLLTVLMHELGHVLGFEHDEGGVMAETLTAGTRQAQPVSVDQSFAEPGRPSWGGAYLDAMIIDLLNRKSARP